MKGTSAERERYFPIASITTFVPRWTIKGRLVDKQPVKATKTGKNFFNGTFVDAAGDAIRANFWADSCSKWSAQLEEGKVYTLSKGRVAVANKKFNNLSHNYELTFDTDADIQEVPDDAHIGSSRSFSFMSLRDIRNSTKETPFMTDILVVVKSVSSLTTVATKQGAQLSKRVITVVDDSEVQFDVTVWGEWAENEDMWPLEKVMALSDIIVRDWQNTRGGSNQRTSRAETKFSQPSDVEAAERLQRWYNTEGASLQFGWMRTGGGLNGPQATRATFEHLPISNIQASSESGFIATGMLRRVLWRAKGGEPRFTYPGCPTCKKKLLLEDSGYAAAEATAENYSCPACNERNVTPDWKFLFSFFLADFTGSLAVRAFGEQGTQIVGSSAADARNWSESKQAQVLDWKLLFKPVTVVMVAKQETYQGETRTVYSTLKVEPVAFHTQAVWLLQKIKEELPDATSFASSGKRQSMSMDVDKADSDVRGAKALKRNLSPKGDSGRDSERQRGADALISEFPAAVKTEPPAVA